MIGFFANTIALRSELSDGMSFVELVQLVKNTTLEDYEYQDIPFEKVIDRLVKERDFSHSPLFQVMFILENEPIQQLKFEDWDGTPEWLDRDLTKFELTFEVTPGTAGTEIAINYFSDLFSEDTIKRMLNHYVQLIRSIADKPDHKISELNILSGEEMEELLHIGKGVIADYKEEKTVINLFYKQVKRSPDAIALIFEEQSITYQELDKRSNKLARLLIEKGVSNGMLIPICLERSFEMVIAILGILKTGAAYVPVDPEFPAGRIHFILNDTRASLLLSTIAVLEVLNLETTVECFAIDDPELLTSYTDDEVVVLVLPEYLAYTIYTSGTTGKPKGVQIRHSGILNRLLWMQDYLSLTAGDIILQKTTFCFDVSVWELLSALLCGAVIVMAKPEGHKDADYLQELIEKHQISIIHFVPSMLDVFLLRADEQKCRSLNAVICSGEELKIGTVTAFQKVFKKTHLYNFYGPTEASIEVTAIKLEQVSNYTHHIPIGKPIANICLYIVDQHHQLQPRGVAGELLIGGVQVALRYLNQPELTAQKFISDRFSKAHEYPFLYRTGDLVRWLPDGNIEFLGRIDDQVKIRGYRIEPAEIEVLLGQLAGVERAVVLVKEYNGDKYLAAFVKLQNWLKTDSLSDQLKNILPLYMVPSIILRVDDFPLTLNGKIDKGQLHAMAAPSLAGVFKAPETEIELKLTRIWKDLLKTDKVGVRDNFFALGGHSLMAMRVLSEISNEFSANISITLFFQLGTIEKLSEYLEVLQSAKILNVQEDVNTIEL
jgi:amino acid adenylation domain-containing protein